MSPRGRTIITKRKPKTPEIISRRIPKKKVTTQTAAKNLARVLQPAQTASTGFVRPVEPVAPAQPSLERRPVEPEPLRREPSIEQRRYTIPQFGAPPLEQIVPPLSQPAQTMLQQTALSLGLNTFGQGPQQDYDVQAIQSLRPSSISVYQGPLGQVGPNEFVVTELADVALIERTSPGTNIFYANPRTGQLEAKAGIMAFVPALMQYLDGGDMPDSVVQTLIDLGLLDDSGVVTAVGSSLTGGVSGGRSIFNRTSSLTGSPGRFSGTRGAALGLVNWRIQ